MKPHKTPINFRLSPRALRQLGELADRGNRTEIVEAAISVLAFLAKCPAPLTTNAGLYRAINRAPAADLPATLDGLLIAASGALPGEIDNAG